MESAGGPADKNFVLLGIKYEAATLGGVGESARASIEAQIRAEVGDSWAEHPMIIQGRNAVRAEHGLSPLGAPANRPPPEPGRTKPSLWRKVFGE